MPLDEKSTDGDILSSEEETLPIHPSKKPYVSPKIIFISELDIANNSSGSGDGDAALAHS